jgi:DNA polymerase-4
MIDDRVSTAPPRKIIHIDMDAFYASVEQRDNPELRGKPVAVGGSAERGVVAAASYEARKFGVRSAMPSITAKRQCPDLLFVKPRFEVYKAISRQIRDIFAEHTPIIEPLSLDEAYLDVTENLQGIPLARDIALRIREKIKSETGLNASAGILTTNSWRSSPPIIVNRTGSTSFRQRWDQPLLNSSRSANSTGSAPPRARR